MTREKLKQPKLRWHNWKSDYEPLYPEDDPREMYSLDHCFAKFIVPRLKRFRDGEHNYVAGHPVGLSMARWKAILDEMIYGFEFFDDAWLYSDRKLYKRLQKESGGKIWEHPEYKAWRKRSLKGRRLFAKWFDSLWC